MGVLEAEEDGVKEEVEEAEEEDAKTSLDDEGFRDLGSEAPKTSLDEVETAGAPSLGVNVLLPKAEGPEEEACPPPADITAERVREGAEKGSKLPESPAPDPNACR